MYTKPCALARSPVLLAILLVIVPPPTWSASAEETATDAFEGPFLSLGVARQNVFAGAAVGGTDVIARESMTVAEIGLGWRWQFASGFVVGAELGYGRFGRELAREVPRFGDLRIDFRGRDQGSLGGHLGYAFGPDRRVLAFVYATETRRAFDVFLENRLGRFRQEDEQGALRWGLGLEFAPRGSNWSLRASTGRLRVDFRAPADLDVEDRFEFALSAVRQFRS